MTGGGGGGHGWGGRRFAVVARRWPHVKYKEFKVGQGQMWVSGSSLYQPGGEGVGRPKEEPGAPRRQGELGGGVREQDRATPVHTSRVRRAGLGQGGRTCLL